MEMMLGLMRSPGAVLVAEGMGAGPAAAVVAAEVDAQVREVWTFLHDREAEAPERFQARMHWAAGAGGGMGGQAARPGKRLQRGRMFCRPPYCPARTPTRPAPPTRPPFRLPPPSMPHVPPTPLPGHSDVPRHHGRAAPPVCVCRRPV